jgi:putative addiction module component (TIGR02574 family)
MEFDEGQIQKQPNRRCEFVGVLLYFIKESGGCMQSDLEGQIKKLSLAERIILVEEIWDSIARENETFELSEDQKKELDRRSQSFSKGRTWDEIRTEFLKS